MIQIIQDITVEVAKPNFFQAIVAKQYDNNSRFLKVTLVHNSKKINVSTTSEVTINAKRNDGESNAFKGVVNEDGTVTVPINFWMLELKGTLICDVSVIGSDDSKLTTTTFIVEVEESACTNGDITTEIVTSVVGAVPIERGGTGAETLLEAAETLGFPSLYAATAITRNTNLDTLTTIGKNYKCTSTSTVATLGNCPTTEAFRMYVYSPAPGVSGYIAQDVYELLGGTRSYRYSPDGGKTWKNWTRSFDSSNVLPVENGGMGFDASVDIGEAEHIEMVQRFVVEMNRMAANIGMSHSSFKTPSGLYTNSVNENNAIYNASTYNSRSTAADIVRLMIAARHTPSVLKAMGLHEFSYRKNNTKVTTTHLVLANSSWGEWATTNGYTILAAKGGSCRKSYGEIGNNSGIYNMVLMLEDKDGKIFCATVIGLQNPSKWSSTATYAKDERATATVTETDADGKEVDKTITYVSLKDSNKGNNVSDTNWWQKENLSEGEKSRAIMHELIELQKGNIEETDLTETNKAKAREPYPVGMMVVELTSNGTFADDILMLNNSKNWKGYNIDTGRATLSVAKILTAIVVVSNFNNHYCTVNYDDLVGGSGISIDKGDVLTTYDALNVMLLRSCNVSATLLARVIGKRLPSA